MFADLPENIQKEILFYLEVNNFQAAKMLLDQSLKANGMVPNCYKKKAEKREKETECA